MLTFGTYRLNESTANIMVRRALNKGIKSFDTAQLYKNEKSVADISAYITTKIHKNSILLADVNSNAIEHALQKSISLIDINCVLLHSPEPGYINAWKQLNELRDDYGFDIGVSNFSIKHLEELKKLNLSMPVINQIEITPFNQCRELALYCRNNSIGISSHSALTKGEKLNHPELLEIGKKYNCSPAQVLISWCLYHDYKPIFRTSNEEHLEENIKCVMLTPHDINTLNTLECKFQTHPQYKL